MVELIQIEVNRDKKGKFAKKGAKKESTTKKKLQSIFIVTMLVGILAYGIGIAAGYTAGHSAGTKEGYTQGIAEKQQAIFDDGFQKGQDIERNWIIDTTSIPNTILLKSKSNPDHIRRVDERMNTQWEYTFWNVTSYFYNQNYYQKTCP